MRINRFWKYALLVTLVLLLGAFLGMHTGKGKHLIYKYCSNSIFGSFCSNLIVVEAALDMNLKFITINLNNSKAKNKPIYKDDRAFWVPHDYGRDIFDVYYKDKLIGKANVFNTNNWHNHIYKFRMNMKADKVVVNFIADGPDGPGEFIYTEDIKGKNRNKVVEKEASFVAPRTTNDRLNVL